MCSRTRRTSEQLEPTFSEFRFQTANRAFWRCKRPRSRMGGLGFESRRSIAACERLESALLAPWQVPRRKSADRTDNGHSASAAGTRPHAPFRPLANPSRAVSEGCGKQRFVPVPGGGVVMVARHRHRAAAQARQDFRRHIRQRTRRIDEGWFRQICLRETSTVRRGSGDKREGNRKPQLP